MCFNFCGAEGSMVSMHLSYIISVLLFSTKGPSVTVGPSGCTPYSSEGMLGYKKSSGEKHFKKKKDTPT